MRLGGEQFAMTRRLRATYYLRSMETIEQRTKEVTYGEGIPRCLMLSAVERDDERLRFCYLKGCSSTRALLGDCEAHSRYK